MKNFVSNNNVALEKDTFYDPMITQTLPKIKSREITESVKHSSIHLTKDPSCLILLRRNQAYCRH